MAHSLYVTRRIPEAGLKLLRESGFDLDINPDDRILKKQELIEALGLRQYEGVLCLLTDTIDREVLDATQTARIYANYAVGYNNIDIDEAKKRGITVTNTPGALTESVAELTVTLMLAITRRVAEADSFVREGKFEGWAPSLFLGSDLLGKTVGILGAGRIGARVAEICVQGFKMRLIYHDVTRNEAIERELKAEFRDTPEAVLQEADIVSVHVPLLESTKHLINAELLRSMKRSAYLINTSRGSVIDESALVEALKEGVIRGAALDVFENEPRLAAGLAALSNVVLTPHIASATEATRSEMAIMAARNLIDFFEGRVPRNKIV